MKRPPFGKREMLHQLEDVREGVEKGTITGLACLYANDDRASVFTVG